jgi:hypothetical protein
MREIRKHRKLYPRPTAPRLPQPAHRADRYRMTTVEVGAVDQDATNAYFAHLAEGDFLRVA